MVVVTARKRLGECIGGSADEHRPRPPSGAPTPVPVGLGVDVLAADANSDEQPPCALPHLGTLPHPLTLLHRNVQEKPVSDECSVSSSYYYIANAAHHARETHLSRCRGKDGFAFWQRVFDATPPGAIRAGRFTKFADDGKVRRQHEPARGKNRCEDQATSWLRSRERNCNTAREWIWETRLSVTPNTSPISASVRFSS